jgi:hypothetical protein
VFKQKDVPNIFRPDISECFIFGAGRKFSMHVVSRDSKSTCTYHNIKSRV